jgi:hypothetical protein
MQTPTMRDPSTPQDEEAERAPVARRATLEAAVPKPSTRSSRIGARMLRRAASSHSKNVALECARSSDARAPHAGFRSLQTRVAENRSSTFEPRTFPPRDMTTIATASS